MVKQKSLYYIQPILISVYSLRVLDLYCIGVYGDDSVNYKRQTRSVVIFSTHGSIWIKMALYTLALGGHVHLIYRYSYNKDDKKLAFSKTKWW